MTMRLSLHTWTLDTTPLADALAVIKKTGWDAVELRRLDFERAAQAGQSADRCWPWCAPPACPWPAWAWSSAGLGRRRGARAAAARVRRAGRAREGARLRDRS